MKSNVPYWENGVQVFDKKGNQVDWNSEFSDNLEVAKVYDLMANKLVASNFLQQQKQDGTRYFQRDTQSDLWFNTNHSGTPNWVKVKYNVYYSADYNSIEIQPNYYSNPGSLRVGNPAFGYDSKL